MYSIYANNEDIAYGINKYIADTEDDLKNIPIHGTPGTTVFVISNSQLYMLNTKKEWKPIQNLNNSSCLYWGIF